MLKLGAKRKNYVLKKILRERKFSGIRPSYKNYFIPRYKVWWLIVLLIFISVAGICTSWQYRIDTAVQIINNHQQRLVDLTLSGVHTTAAEAVRHASELRDLPTIKQFLLQETDNNKNDLQSLLSNAIDAHSTFDSINILDNAGMEIIGVSAGRESALALPSREFKDYTEDVIFSRAGELLDNQFLVSPVIPLVGEGALVTYAIPTYRISTPLVVSGKRYGYLVYHLRHKTLFNRAKAIVLGDLPKAELDVYTQGGVWSTQLTPPEWTWAPLPSEAMRRRMFGDGVVRPSPERISEQWMQFVYLYDRTAPQNTDIAAIYRREFRDGQELISSVNAFVPVVLRVDYEGILSTVRLSARERWVELAAAVLAAIICAWGINWLWLKVSGWDSNRRREERELKDIANKDFLTDVMTRKAFLAYAESDFIPSPALPQACTILMLDLDFFKEVNDSYGHLAGDSVLKRMTEAFQIGFGEYDQIARWGGDEFVLLLTNIEPSQILAVAERIRLRVIEIKHDVGGSVRVQVSVSIGAASVRGGSAMDSVSVMDAIKCADKALYQAKRDGGNRVAMISEEAGLNTRAYQEQKM